MAKIYKVMDNFTTLFIFVMTFVVGFILSVAQTNDIGLAGKNLFLFITGFLGSIACIVIRFIFLYFKALQQSSVIRKISMIIYLIIWSAILVGVLGMTIQLTHFSIEHRFLSDYNACQIFMLVILLAQWLGEKISR